MKRTQYICAWLFLALFVNATCSAQVSSKETHVDAQLLAMADDVAGQNAAAKPHPEYAVDAQTPNLVMDGFIADHYTATYGDTTHYFLSAVATTQTKTQNGAVPNASGSTSLVQSPLTNSLLGLAIENGAVLDDVNGTTLTLSSSPYAMVASFAGDTDSTYNAYGYLARLGASGSFQIADTTSPLSSVNGKQLSNAGVTLRLTKDTSSRSAAALSAFNTTYEPLQKAAAVATSKLQQSLFAKDPILIAAVKKYITTTHSAIVGVLSAHGGESESQISAAIKPILAAAFDDELAPVLHSLSTHPDTEVAAYLKAQQAYIDGNDAFQKAVAGLVAAPAASLIYNYQQPTNANAYHEAGFTFADASLKNSGDLTFNALVSLYPKAVPTANQGTFRGASAAIQFTAKFKRSPFVKDVSDQSPITLALSGKYDRIQENQHVTGKKADIGLGNLKLTIPLAGGLSFPLSFTFANAGQSIKESYVRGNFGLTFDLDKLSALLKN